MLYAVIADHLGTYLWMGYSPILAEVIILLVFKLSCLLTVIAREYSDSRDANFDIYLPVWLAGHNKSIYAATMLITIAITILRLAD